jgi:hypothetical protein
MCTAASTRLRPPRTWAQASTNGHLLGTAVVISEASCSSPLCGPGLKILIRFPPFSGDDAGCSGLVVSPLTILAPESKSGDVSARDLWVGDTAAWGSVLLTGCTRLLGRLRSLSDLCVRKGDGTGRDGGDGVSRVSNYIAPHPATSTPTCSHEEHMRTGHLNRARCEGISVVSKSLNHERGTDARPQGAESLRA